VDVVSLDQLGALRDLAVSIEKYFAVRLIENRRIGRDVRRFALG
jgi:hypothetical protein